MNFPIIGAKQLKDKLENQNLIILDCSPKSNKAGLNSNYGNEKIEGARYFDLKNDFSDPGSNYPNTLPTSEQFSENCRKLGISNSSEIIVYDNLGVYTSPRVWWMFNVMGHNDVSVLNGGLPTKTNYASNIELGNFTSNFRKEMISDFDFIKKNLIKKNALIIDARNQDRFNGVIAEPREGLRSGNIPNSINIPFQDVLENGKFKEKNQLRLVFKDIDNESKKLVFSCGSGVTACIVYLASELILNNKKSLYDGSWTEWGSLVN
ncbi:sulfurtransferase [Autumnicola edwardsiae]|uniref:Sulfurtransferase n=1 Tax=Autumnicola edwardsiae TaxID=3075594 RepID=A0ABU3CZS3_9FLAO|nr:sulfurtransferase [Zunongwangia sp. F297]MDT0651687.1 sulfurtransferase [Zunongwangia sp. F297]